MILPSRADWAVLATVGALLIVSIWLSYRPIPTTLTGEVVALESDADPRAALDAPSTGQDGRRGTAPIGIVRWLRYDLSASDEIRYVTVEPATLDTLDVTLFAADAERLLSATLGDRHVRPSESAVALRQNLALPPLPAGGVLVVRLETKGMNAVTLNAVSASAFAQRDALSWLGLAIFFGGRMLLLVLSTIEARAHRQAVWGWFAAQNLTSVAYSLAVSGALKILLPNVLATWIDALSTFAAIAYMATTFIFHAHMLMLFDAPKRMVRFTLAGSAVPFAAFALALGGATAAALALTSFSIVGFGLIVLGSAAAIRAGAGAPKAMARLAYGVVGSTALAQALPIVGWAPMSQFSIQGGALTPLVGGLLALWLLLHRAEGQRRALAGTERRLALAEQRAVLDRASRLDADRFVGVLAHTIRTPLSLIRLVLEDGGAGERARELARLAVRDVDGVLERCVQLARLELGEAPIRRSPTNVREVIASAIEWTHLTDRTRCQGPDSRANVDAHALASILFELLDNAARYAPHGSTVDVTWTCDPRSLTLAVGSSIGRLGTLDPEQAFERYARGDKAHAVTGAGLGLHLVRALAERHDGGARYLHDGDRVLVEVTLAC